MQRIWFITGGSSGFGLALAEAVLARGDGGVACARRTSVLDKLASAHGQAALAVGLDVTDTQARERAVEAALNHFGRIDVLVNNAGTIQVGPVGSFWVIVGSVDVGVGLGPQ